MLLAFSEEAFGWSPAEWGRATLRRFSDRHDAWTEGQRRLDHRASAPLMAAGVKRRDIEAVFPLLKRPMSVRENMDNLEAMLAARGRRGPGGAG